MIGRASNNNLQAAAQPTDMQFAPLRDKRTLRYTLVLALLAISIYANSLLNGYVYDDGVIIQHNSLVKSGIKEIPVILTSPYHFGDYNYRIKGYMPVKTDLYRPLSVVMFAVEYQLFGEDPFIGHSINVLLYAGCAVLFFLFLQYIFKGSRPVIAFVAALLFTLHPIHTEVVANIKSRDELLCFFFGFLALNACIRFVSTGRYMLLAVAMACYFLSLLSKETAVTLLLIFLLVFFFYRNEQIKRSIYISIAALCVLGIYLCIRFAVLQAYDVAAPADYRLIDNALAAAPSAVSRLATALFVLGYYIRLLLVPYPLICDYGYNSIPFVDLSNIWVWLSVIVYLGMLCTAAYRLFSRRSDPFAFGVLFYLVTIALFSNIFFLIGSEMSERFAFLPSCGICICLAFFMERLVLRSGGNSVLSILKDKYALSALLVISCCFIGITLSRNTDWRDNMTLVSHDSRKMPGNCMLHYFKANELVALAGKQAAGRQQLLAEAIQDYRHALSIYPAYGNARIAISDAFIQVMQLDSAELHGKIAVKLMPGDPAALNALANVYIGMQRYNEARTLSREAYAINPGNANYPRNAGVSFLLTRRYDSAVYYFNRAIDIDPANDKSYVFMAIAFHEAGLQDSAKKYEAIVHQFDPGFDLNTINNLPYK